MNKEALEIMKNGKQEERIYIASKSFGMFAVYYFSDYFKYSLAPYHYEMIKELERLEKGEDIRELVFIMFRESGKTVFSKLFIIWLIVFNKRKYINVDSFDKENAERILFDIAYELSNNNRLKADFGSLFSKKRGADDVKQTKINNFITENGIRVEAHSTQESVRGRIHLNQRPDFLLCHRLGTKILYKNNWINVEEHPTFKKSRLENGKKIKIHSLPFEEYVTNEHRYWVKYIPLERTKGTTIRKYKDKYTGWEEAKNLTKYHFIGTPINYTEESITEKIKIFTPGHISKRDKKGKIVDTKNVFKEEVPKEFLNKDWWFLFGLWWADGNLSGKTNNDSVITFTIANNDIVVAEKVKNILFKYNIKYWVNPKIGCYQLSFSNAKIGRWLRTWRTGNSIKQPPFWVEKVSIDYQKELIKGYIAGDGFVDLKNKEIRITSVNLNGLLCVRRILARIGIPSSIRNGIDGIDDYMIMGVKCKTQKKYDLRFRQNAKYLGFDIENQTRYKYTEVFIQDGFLWSKIDSIENSGMQEFCPIKTEDSQYVSHYGLSHNCDDFETNKTKDSQAYTKQIRDHITEAMAGMSTDASILYLGNYITEYGNVQFLLERAKSDPKIKVLNIPVLIDGQPSWKSKYCLTDDEAKTTGKVSIEDKQRQLGSQVFSYEMMNTPIDDSVAEFKKEYFQTATEDEIKHLKLNTFIAIDPAVSQKESADFTGVTINRVSTEGKRYIIAYRLKINTMELIEHIFYLHDTYRPEIIGLEETAFTLAVKPFFEEEMRKRNKFITITPLKHGGIKKETRIRGLIPLMESKSVFFVGDCSALIDEMRVFPRGQKDDTLDSFCYSEMIAYKPFDKSFDVFEESEPLYSSIGI